MWLSKDSKVQVTVLQHTWKGLQAKHDYSSAPSLHPEMDAKRQENCKKKKSQIKYLTNAVCVAKTDQLGFWKHLPHFIHVESMWELFQGFSVDIVLVFNLPELSIQHRGASIGTITCRSQYCLLHQESN